MSNKCSLLTYILIVLVLSGCAMSRAPKATDDYTDGYEDGKAAAPFISFAGILTGINQGALAYVPGVSEPAIPEVLLEKIQEKPLDYQKGFKAGYRESVENDAFIFGTIFEALQEYGQER